MENPICQPVEQDFRLIETFGYHPGQGIARATLHVQRLQASAEELGFEFDRRTVMQQLDNIAFQYPRRCRLTLGRAGDLELTTAPFPVKQPQMCFVIAEERLESGAALLRHKTTLRDRHDRARASLPVRVDEAVFLNERDEVCEGTITNISITTPDGDRLTPPLSSGCLPGVYRQSRLNKGLLNEAVLTLADLNEARSINLVNSLRGSTQAIWAPECAEFIRFA
ncbi:4-amino-4-deoxychorismate lyase [Rhodobacterales bacterium 56_14_T64]|nr:4-amino-4-deoxychorismate lyase [Rhodobacterales bacterium 56_14_T64]